MLSRLMSKLQAMNRKAVPFDASRFNDPVAVRTAWAPLKSGGSNFRAQKLVRATPYRIEIRASAEAVFFYSIFLLGGLAALSGITYVNYSQGRLGLNMNTIMPVVFGTIFAAVGGVMLYFGTIPVVFDKMRGMCWKGRRGPPGYPGNAGRRVMENYTALDRVHALQIISELCSGKNSTYYSYELNLVLEDGERINVADHGKLDKLRADAVALSQFLGKPLWDTTV